MHPTYLVVLVAIAATELLSLSGTAASISSSCSNKFIFEDGAYFKKHGELVDSDLLDHGLNLASLHSTMRVAYLHRDLIGEGSHRHLCSSISFNVQPESANLLSRSICEFVIIERLPNGVFADPFELEHLVDRGVFKDAAVFGDTNLELPSFVSNQSVVEIHMLTAIDFSATQKNSLELKIEIPVHARYQPLDESGYTRVRFGAPDLFRCSAEGQSNSKSCSLKSIARDTDLDSGHVEWSIPSGIKAHGLAVSILTFCSALFAAASIIVASLHNSDIRLRQRSKQS